MSSAEIFGFSATWIPCSVRAGNVYLSVAFSISSLNVISARLPFKVDLFAAGLIL